jgi:Glycosyl transferase family 2
MSLTSLDGIRRSKASLEAFIGSRTAAHFGPSSTPETRPFDPRISIVIPTLNEASNLPFVFSTIASLDAEVIVVDGRSSDDTVRVAKALREDVVVVHEIRRGKGAALQAGFAAATGDIFGVGPISPREAASSPEAEAPTSPSSARPATRFSASSSAPHSARNSPTFAMATTRSGVTACRT